MVQTYDNNSVISAERGVKALSDITANYYNKCRTYSQSETNNLLSNKVNTGFSYSKGEDDILLLLKADKTQLIDSYTKGETNNLLNNKADSGTSYTKSQDDALLLAKADKTQLINSYKKGEDDALLLLKADKTKLIDSYTKVETNNQLNDIADSRISHINEEDEALMLLKADKTQFIESCSKSETFARDEVYSKDETNNLLNSKANQSTTYSKDEVYIKTETDYLISQIEVGDIGTTLTINANKTFNNSCRFTNTIDGMSTITGASFVKSGADDIVVLPEAGGTIPISEFGGSVNDSNCVKKTGQATQSIEGNLIRSGSEISFENLQPFQYITKQDAKYGFVQKEGIIKEMDNKYLRLGGSLTITGAKTFTISLTAPEFVKYIGKKQQILLADGTTKPISESFTLPPNSEI
ncbi:MAG: hypothetical protein EZS28_028615, partial [Streblomastix strix]